MPPKAAPLVLSTVDWAVGKDFDHLTISNRAVLCKVAICSHGHDALTCESSGVQAATKTIRLRRLRVATRAFCFRRPSWAFPGSSCRPLQGLPLALPGPSLGPRPLPGPGGVSARRGRRGDGMPSGASCPARPSTSAARSAGAFGCFRKRAQRRDVDADRSTREKEEVRVSL